MRRSQAKSERPLGLGLYLWSKDQVFLTQFLHTAYWFWEACEELRWLPQKKVSDKVNEIWYEFLAPDASCPVNIDSHSHDITKKNMETHPDRWTFDAAAAHVYHLMKTDSYSRYLRSEMYKDFLQGSKKKTSMKGIRSIVSFSGRKDGGSSS